MLTEHRATFCARLRAAREEKGVSLEQIAVSTKIPASMFKGLEGHDVSRWPKGLYRRSYLRDYLRVIGLSPDPIVAEFLRLFPDPDDGAPVVEEPIRPVTQQPSPLAMTLVDDRTTRGARRHTRIVAAIVDAAIVLVMSLALAPFIPADAGASVACVALGYYSIATASFGRSVGSRWLDERRVAQWKRRAAAPVARRPLMEHLRDVLATGAHASIGRQLARVAWNGVLLRIWFLR